MSPFLFGKNGAAGGKKKAEKIKTPKASGEKKGEQIANKKQPYRVKRRKTIPRGKSIFLNSNKKYPEDIRAIGGNKVPTTKSWENLSTLQFAAPESEERKASQDTFANNSRAELSQRKKIESSVEIDEKQNFRL